MNSRNIKIDSGYYNFTPLIMNASQKDDCGEATALLLEAGADINATDALGKTALDHALARNLENVVAVLRAHGTS